MKTNMHIAANDAGIPAYVDLEALWKGYAPYDNFPEFYEGFGNYLLGKHDRQYDGVQAQAYDRGLEAGSRAMRSARWIQDNVGCN